MAKELVALDRDCLNCGKPLFSKTPNNPKPKKYCDDQCRYEGWQKRNLGELTELVAKLARHGLRLDTLQVAEEKATYDATPQKEEVSA